MKKLLIFIALGFSAWMMLTSCSTSEERAARAAERSKKVTAALNEKNYKISVNRMNPMRGEVKSLSYGYSVIVRNDSLYSSLPYFGRAYNVPYGGGEGLNFSAPITNYKETQKKEGLRLIKIDVATKEDTFLYIIEMFDNGSATIDVISHQRDQISFTGQMEVE